MFATSIVSVPSRPLRADHLGCVSAHRFGCGEEAGTKDVSLGSVGGVAIFG